MRIGLSKEIINVPLLPVAMKGYGDWNNRVDGKETDLHARIFIIENDEVSLFYGNVEILVITPSLKREVLKDIKVNHSEIPITDDNFMLSSQHTHSAPSGYSEYAFHTITTPGISTEIFNSYKSAIVKAVVSAYKGRFKGEVGYASGDFEEDIPVAWNRSISAYNANLNLEKVHSNETSKAIDRTMKMLVAKDENGAIKGTLNWFGVHGTSIGPKNTKISFDNKGYAAQFLENDLEGTINIFSQGKSGDVSPHFHGEDQFRIRKEVSKKGDHKYAEKNGKIQYLKAKEIINTNKLTELESGSLDFVTMYFDFTNIDVDPKYTIDGELHKTSDACVGSAMFQGTPIDGPGISNIEAAVFVGVNNFVNKKAKALKESQGNKNIILNASTREFLGRGKLNVLPGFIDPQIKVTNKMAKIGAINEHSIIPSVLPIQIFLLGNIVLASLPIEITTNAGHRLEQSLLKGLESKGVNTIIIAPYANSYAGYITTTEEYDVQNYEGGHTVFGRHTLGALQTNFDVLCEEIKKPKESRKQSGIEKMPIFSKDQLVKRMYPFK